MKSLSVRALVALALPAALLSACATPENRIRTGLMRAGLSPPMADCMAESMSDRLSTAQLRRLASLAEARDIDPRRTSVQEALDHIRAIGDPEIVRVAASAAVGCSLL